MKNNEFRIITTVFFVSISAIFSLRLLFGKYSIFNYLNKKSYIETLSRELSKKSKVRERLAHQAGILSDTSKVNIDILEEETIKKLNRIPRGYFIITE